MKMKMSSCFAAFLVLAALPAGLKAQDVPAAYAAASAQAAAAKRPEVSEAYIKPNNSYDGPLYRALVGPNVKTDFEGARLVEFRGTTLIKCAPGHGRGPKYNDYDCELFFSKATGAAASAVKRALDDDKEMVLRVENGGKCSFTYCQTFTSLVCRDRSFCGIVSSVSGWDE